MRTFPLIVAALAAVLALAAQSPARAQTASPQQIQGMIASGQEQAALAQLQAILQAHPDSGVAWYLSAEAQDASGNEAAARTALANAQQDAPGLPFARPDEVAALQAHLDGNSMADSAPRRGVSPLFIGVIGLVVVFLVLRMFFRRQRLMAPGGYPPGYGPAPGQYPFGQGGGPGGFGSGLGGSLLGGLAAGAGFAAGERVIDDVFGRNTGDGGFQQDPNFGNGVPDRDDGLQGNPGWDAGSSGQDDNFDPGNSW